MSGRITAEDLGRRNELGDRATLVQISSAFCAPCRTARVVLRRTAEQVDGVRHVEVDVAGHEALAERVGVRSTPTILVIDADGHVRQRLDGVVPRLAWLKETVEQVVGADTARHVRNG